MAGAGFKDFVAGDVLTADDVDTYLMQQSVMVFAGTAARGSAISSPSEGMVTYLQDSDQLQVYTTDWTPVGASTSGHVIQVASTTKTDVFSASVVGGGSVDVTGLSLSFEVSDSANKVLIMGSFGAFSNSVGVPLGGIGITVAGTAIALGDADGSRLRLTAGGRTSGATDTGTSYPVMFNYLHTPGAGSKTYQLTAHNGRTDTRTIYVNRSAADANSAEGNRTVSTLTLLEIGA